MESQAAAALPIIDCLGWRAMKACVAVARAAVQWRALVGGERLWLDARPIAVCPIVRAMLRRALLLLCYRAFLGMRHRSIPWTPTRSCLVAAPCRSLPCFTTMADAVLVGPAGGVLCLVVASRQLVGMLRVSSWLAAS